MRPLAILEDSAPTPLPARSSYVLRASVIDRCQLACRYCMPGSVRAFARTERWLTADDYGRIAPLLFERGVRKVRFTGGEPLLRPDLAAILGVFSRAMPGAPLALTTNGQRLAERPQLIDELAAAGLSRATVHIDSLRPERYRASMGRGSLQDALKAVVMMRRALDEVKLNVVVQRGVNDDELGEFLDWSADTGVQVRFIELMNTGSARAYTNAHFISGREMVASLAHSHGAAQHERRHLADPASLFHTRAGVVFGVIASDTEPFCGACDRLRLTVDGRLRGCLYQEGGVPLAALARAGDADALRAAIGGAIASKASHHPCSTPIPAPLDARLPASRHEFSMAEAGG